MQFETPTPQTPESEASIGIHIPTVLRAVWRLRRFVVLGVVVAVAAGLVAGYGLGTRVYESSTLLLFQPGAANEERDADLEMTTQLHLVKLPEALMEVRERVDRPLSVQALGSAIRVDRQGKTDLVRIAARDSGRRESAELANTVRDVFLDRQRSQNRDETTRRIEAITARLASLRRELEVADSTLQDYAQSNRIVDLDKEAQWFLEELTAVNLLWEQAQSDVQSNQLQRENIDAVVEEIRRTVEDEQEAASLEGLGTLNIRVERLRDAIQDDQRQRAMEAELAQREIDLEKARQLHESGWVSDVELQRLQNAYDRQLAYTRDTEQVAKWRTDLDSLQNMMLPSSGSSPSEPLLRDIMLRKFDIELEGVTLEQRVEHLGGARARVQARLDSIPLLERGYFARMREVQVREKVLEDLEKDLADAQTQLQSENISFQLISEAVPPIFPLNSNRRTLFAMAVVGLSLLTLIAIVAVAALDPRLRSLGEAQAKTDLAFAGEYPALTRGTPDTHRHPAIERRLQRLARKLRMRAPDRGQLLLVASPTPGEGATSIARALAHALGRQDESVLLIEMAGGDDAETPTDYAGRGEPLEAEFLILRRNLAEGATRLDHRIEEKLPARTRVKVRRVRRPLETLVRRGIELRERVAARIDDLRHRQEADPRAIAETRDGFSAVASLDSDLDTVGTSGQVHGVRHVPAGAPVPSEMLRSKALIRALDEARDRYDLILINPPALTTSAHALHLADLVDGMVLVVRAEGPSTSRITRATRDFTEAGTPIVGAVLNRVHSEFLEAA